MSEHAKEVSENLLELPAHVLVRRGNCEARVCICLWREELPSLPLHPCSPLWEKIKPSVAHSERNKLWQLSWNRYKKRD